MINDIKPTKAYSHTASSPSLGIWTRFNPRNKSPLDHLQGCGHNGSTGEIAEFCRQVRGCSDRRINITCLETKEVEQATL